MHCSVFDLGVLVVQVVAAIEDGVSRAEEQISDLDLRVFKHDAYSKGFIKRHGISPDAYIQMALQLAYYRVGCSLLRCFPRIG